MALTLNMCSVSENLSRARSRGSRRANGEEPESTRNVRRKLAGFVFIKSKHLRSIIKKIMQQSGKSGIGYRAIMRTGRAAATAGSEISSGAANNGQIHHVVGIGGKKVIDVILQGVLTQKLGHAQEMRILPNALALLA